MSLATNRNQQEWMTRAFKNGRRWHLAARKLQKAHMTRQAFVAATYANEEFAKAFLLWWRLATGKDVSWAVSRHEVKQGLAFCLAFAGVWDDESYDEYLKRYSDKFVRLVEAENKEYRFLADDSWEQDRSTAIYEEAKPARVDRGTINLTMGIAAELQPKIRSLMMVAPGRGYEDGPIPLAIVEVFALKQHFVERVLTMLR